MNRISFVGRIRYLGIIAIVMQGILLALLTLFLLNSQYQEKWSRYPEDEHALTVYLKNVSSEKKDAVEQYLYEAVDEQNLFMARRDSFLDNNGVFAGFMFGVYGNTDDNDMSFDFLDKKIISNKDIKTLIRSNNQASTLGIAQGSVNSIGVIPSFRFGEKIVIKKMQQLISDSGTINGTYYIIGLQNVGKKADFLNSLSAVSNISSENLIKKTSGETIDDNFKKLIIIGFIFAQFILNIVFFLVITIRNLSKGGKLALLGWSRIEFCWELLGSFFVYAVINIPVQIIIGLILSGWNEFSTTILSYFVMYALINVILVVIELGVSAIVVLVISPLNAIHGRIPKKTLYFLGIMAYIGISAGILFCGIYVDVPIKTMSENANMSERWESVSEYQILESISVGQDENSFTGQSKQLDQNIYDWYKSISSNNEVYLVNNTYYDSSILELWKNNSTYEETPDNPFWYFTVSPNYAKELGIKLDDSVVSKALSGTRIYLIPNTLSDNEKDKMIAWLEESVVRGISEGDIATKFNTDRKIEIVTYTPSNDFFTWATKSDEAIETISPIIYICTPENMRYFESESLRATGLDGYIKFLNEKTRIKYTDETILSEYGLSDNELTFSKVQNYIDGLQKNLRTTVLWFGLVFVILLLILIGILLALASIFRIENLEKINVKKFLGFGFWQIYLGPMIMLVGMICIEVLIMILMKSQFGLGLILIVAVIQIVIFTKYMIRCEIREILTAFKEE